MRVAKLRDKNHECRAQDSHPGKWSHPMNYFNEDSYSLEQQFDLTSLVTRHLHTMKITDIVGKTLHLSSNCSLNPTHNVTKSLLFHCGGKGGTHLRDL